MTNQNNLVIMNVRALMKKQYWIILGIIWHIFTFLQSALPGEQSASQSGLIVDYIYPFIHKIGITL